MKKISLPVLIVAAVAAIHWLPNLLTKGMFVDGVYHALFAHNFALGIGSFWAPQTADYAHPSYWDNPQLSGYFLSLWYKVLGDHYWVEKLYSLGCALIQLLLIASLWKTYFYEKKDLKKYAWLPVLLFLIIPLTSWGYSSNLMENAMSIFTTASVIVFLFFLRTGKNLLLYSLTGGALIFLALLTKGPVALFPLAAPFFFLWTEKQLKWQKAFGYMLLQFAVVAAIFAFVFWFEAPRNFLQQYLNQQLLKALNSERSTGARYTIFIHLLIALSPLLVLSIISVFVSRKSPDEKKSLLKTALVFIVIGLSASAPIALSAKQNKHYLIPSLPLFATGFACLILPLIKWFEQKLMTLTTGKAVTIAKSVCMLIIAGCIFLCAYNKGSYSRDEKLLRDMEAIVSLGGRGTAIPTSSSLYSDWALRANLNRHYDVMIAMPGEAIPGAVFFLTKAGEEPGGSKICAKIYSGKMYDLYRCLP